MLDKSRRIAEKKRLAEELRIQQLNLEEEIINDSLVVELDSSSTQLKENELKVTDSVKSKINKLPKNSTK